MHRCWCAPRWAYRARRGPRTSRPCSSPASYANTRAATSCGRAPSARIPGRGKVESVAQLPQLAVAWRGRFDASDLPGFVRKGLHGPPFPGQAGFVRSRWANEKPDPEGTDASGRSSTHLHGAGRVNVAAPAGPRSRRTARGLGPELARRPRTACSTAGHRSSCAAGASYERRVVQAPRTTCSPAPRPDTIQGDHRLRRVPGVAMAGANVFRHLPEPLSACCDIETPASRPCPYIARFQAHRCLKYGARDGTPQPARGVSARLRRGC